MSKLKTNYLDSPIGKTLFLKSLPVFLGIFASIAYNLVDTFFVAKLGTRELAAMSFCFPVVMIILNIMMGVSVGVNSLASRALGENQEGRAIEISQRGLQFSIFLAGAISTVGLLTMDPLFTLLGVDKDLMPLVREYMVVWYAGSVFWSLSVVGSSIFRAKGNVFYPSLVLILGAIVNTILDPILIFGWGPIPSLGVKGAAITTVFGNAISAYLILSKLSKEEKIPFSSLFKSVDFSLMRKILVIAAPTALASSLPPVSTAFTNWMLVVYGNAAVAANSIAMRIETVPFMAIFALSSVLASFIGQNWGAKNMFRVQEALKKSFLFSYLLGLVSAAFLFIYRQSVSAVFDSSPQVIEITGLYFSLVPITYGLLGSVFLTTHALNAIGRSVSGNLLSVSRLVIIYFPLTYVLNFYFSVGGIFAARLIANSIVGIFAAILVYQVFFKTKEAMQKSPDLLNS
jgi:putative MATE family efflux protein